LVTDKQYPCDHPFLEESYSKSNDLFVSVFLMSTASETDGPVAYWNKSKVYLIPEKTKTFLSRAFIDYFFDFRFLIPIIRILKKEKINIVNVRSRIFPLFLSLLLRPILKIKVVYQKSHPYEINALERDLCRVHRYPTLKYGSNKIRFFVLHKMLKRCDAVLPITEYMKLNLNREHKIPNSRMYPFTMGINPTYIKRRKSPVQSLSKLKLVYVGTLVAERNIEKMLLAIKLVLERSPSSQIEVSFVGGRHNDIKRLKKIAEGFNISDNIRFYGQIKRNNVYTVIGSHHIGISYIPHDHRFFDSSPTKLMEYIGIGLPVIATDCVLLQRKIVNETGAGLLCKDDPDDIAQKIIMLIQNIDYYSEKAVASYDYIIENYDYRLMSEKLCKIFDCISG